MINPLPITGGLANYVFWGNGNGACTLAGGIQTETLLAISVVPIWYQSANLLVDPRLQHLARPACRASRDMLGNGQFMDVIVNNGAMGTLTGAR